MVLLCVAVAKLCAFMAMAPQPAQPASKTVILAKATAKGLMFPEVGVNEQLNAEAYAKSINKEFCT